MIYFAQRVVIKSQQFSLLPEARITFSGWLSKLGFSCICGGFPEFMVLVSAWWKHRKSRQMSRHCYHRWMEHLGPVRAALQLSRNCRWTLQCLYLGSCSMCWVSWCWQNWHCNLLGGSPGRSVSAGKPRMSLELAAKSWKLVQELPIQDKKNFGQN